MGWFAIALWAPFLLACANHNDKFLLSRHLAKKTIGAVAITSALFSALAVPVVLLLQPDVTSVTIFQAAALVATGMSSILGAVFYLHALDTDEASRVAPLYQTVPVFAYILGYFVLGETITLAQGFGSIVVIVGALALSFEVSRGEARLKRSLVALMLGASLLSAGNGVIFKLIAVDKGFLVSLFWGYAGQVLAGLTLLTFIPAYRADFLALLHDRRKAAIGLIALSRVLFGVSEAITLYATLLAPVALVLLVGSFQPLFVLAIGITLTILVPTAVEESLRHSKLLQKGVGIGLMLAGSYFVSG
jgi:drug/metabolite transporter (DMT)-like permease